MSPVLLDALKNRFRRDAPAALWHEMYLHPLLAQVQPGIDIARKLALGGNHAVALLPGQALRNHHHAIARTGRESDLLRLRPDHIRHAPVCPLHAGIVAAIINIFVQAASHRSRQRPISRVIQIHTVARNRKKELADILCFSVFSIHKFMLALFNQQQRLQHLLQRRHRPLMLLIQSSVFRHKNAPPDLYGSIVLLYAIQSGGTLHHPTAFRHLISGRYTQHTLPLVVWRPPIPKRTHALPLLLGGRSRRKILRTWYAMGWRRIRTGSNQALNILPIDFVHLSMGAGRLFQRQVFGMNRALVHPAEEFHAHILEPVRIEIHRAVLAQRVDVNWGGHEGIISRRAVSYHLACIINDMRITTSYIHRMLHAGMRVDRANVWTKHIDAVKLCMSLILDQPRTAARIAIASHRNGFTGPVDHLRPIESQGAHGLGVFPVTTADSSDYADIRSAQHRIKRLDSVTEYFYPARVDIVGHRRVLAAPDVVFGTSVNYLSLRVDDRQRIEIAVSDDFRPARLALENNVGFVMPGQPPQKLCLFTRDINENITGGSDVGNIVNFIGEAGQSSLGKRDHLHRQVDGDDAHSRMDRILNCLQIDTDLPSLTHCVDNRRDAYCGVRSYIGSTCLLC